MTDRSALFDFANTLPDNLASLLRGLAAVADDETLNKLGALLASAQDAPQAWCQPMDCGKHTPRKFVILFDDPDHGTMVFDNEADARAAFAKKNTAWNCYLFGTLPLQAPALPERENPIGQGLRRTQRVMCAADMEAKIEALAHRFWSIHPSSLDDMGLTRKEFYAHEMTKLLASTLPERERRLSPERLIGGTAFCGHGVMASICDRCNPWLRLQNEDPPLKWLLQELRRLAKDSFDAGELLSAMSPKEHIFSLAADLIEYSAPTALPEGSR